MISQTLPGLDLAGSIRGHKVAQRIHRVSQSIIHCINLQNSNRQWAEADSSEVVTLENIADHFSTYAGRTAQEILNAYYDQNWFIPPAIGGDWSPRILSVSLSNAHEEHLIKLYPNPANVAITAEITLPSGVEHAVFRIVDSSGKEIHTHHINRPFEIFTLHTNGWASGHYTWGIHAGNLYKTGKLVVNH